MISTEIETLKQLSEEIASGLMETNKELILQVIHFIGKEKAQMFYEETLKLEQSGGILIKSGERRRTPGGAFFFLIRTKLPVLESEILFPVINNGLPIHHYEKGILDLTKTQVAIGIQRIDEHLRLNRRNIPNNKINVLIEKKNLLIKREVELNQEETNQKFENVKKAAEEIQDQPNRNSLLERVKELEQSISDYNISSKNAMDVEIQRKKMEIELEAEERRSERKLKFFTKFIEKESIASLCGALILILITITLLISMSLQKIDSKIIENGFLVLLGYFFGHSTKSK